MAPIRIQASSSKRKREEQPSASGTEQADTQSSHPSSRRRLQPGPALKRADSFPARLPSDSPQRTEVKPVRHPITRPTPDTKPPVNFQTNGDIFEGSLRKNAALNTGTGGYAHYESLIRRDPEFREIIYSRHPDIDLQSEERKIQALENLVNHPRFRAEFAKARNEAGAIPNSATASRTMRPDEQKFLTLAFRRIEKDIQKHPFHIHGEISITGNKDGEPIWMKHFPGCAAKAWITPGDKYNLHSHPPLMEPLTSSASESDHQAAAIMYRYKNNQMGAYVMNGKDVLHIQPDSTELVKLVPDPKEEARLGKFPVAFELPDPRQPPHPFSNHESPAAFKPWAPWNPIRPIRIFGAWLRPKTPNPD